MATASASEANCSYIVAFVILGSLHATEIATPEANVTFYRIFMAKNIVVQ